MSTLLIIILILVLVGGFGSYSYEPFRGYTLPGAGAVLFILLVLYLIGVLR
jgi:hypothetical protein